MARADGNVTDQSTFVIGKDGKVVGGNGAPGIAANYNDAPAADGSAIATITAGVAPSGPEPVPAGRKDRGHRRLRRSVTPSGWSPSGAQPTVTGTMVGTVRFGDSGNLVGATLTVMDTATAQQLYLGGADAFNDIAVTGDGSLSNAAAPRRGDRRRCRPGFEAVDDQQIAAENEDQLQQGLSFITTFLLVFAAVALIVGSFLILNTFSIIVAQRTRELALFRALGASRRQVTRSVMFEALVVGLVGSTVGLLLGFGLAPG